jgi:uncharacterized phage protein (TIGR01671 family)
MNREIKFRVWDTDGNHWEKDEENELLFCQDEGKFKYHQNKLDKYHEYIIQQYTGVKDKNDKEIYEGDIIKYNKEGYDKIGPGIIGFFAGMFICSWKDQTDDELGYMMIDDMEVVGNIFENTNL